MADTPVNLHALGHVAIQDATQRLAAGGSVDRWEQEMARILAREHTAALIAGTAERAGVPVNPGLFRGLSRAERAELNATVKAQLGYLKRFADDVRAGRLSPAQIAARAELYAGPARATYYRSKYPGLGNYPGDGSTACLANCKCSLEERDGVIWWRLNVAEHCGDCLTLAANSPYVRTEAA